MSCRYVALLCLSGCLVAPIHAQHATAQRPVRSETVRYSVPAVTLVREDGKVVSLPQEMNDGRPVVLNFIFTSCGSTCPLMSQVLAQFQRQLGPEGRQVHLMSISIDPEEDTPARLVEYARQFGAGPQWQHYTGTLEASRATQRAFDVYRGDKMSHAAVTLMRAAPDQPWLRIDGLVTPDELVREYRLALASTTTVGQRIYREGVLESGQPVQAQRGAGMQMAGAAAACVNCHRRSGLGMKEGRTSIPPIAGSYLFHPRAGTVDDLDLPFVEQMRPDRDPYTDETLARAIRTGVGADGKPLSYLMPHYALDDEQMAELIAYLKSLSPGRVPGVTDSMLHFATIITPDASPVERQGVLDVLEKFFQDKNRYVRAQTPRLRSSRRMMFKVNRPWALHVWQLTGESETWEAQLRAHLSAEPVFAVISGVGGSNWAPVHRFCEEQSLPCLFPNLDLPVAESDFDNLYLSKGVLLEAQLLAQDIKAPQVGSPPAHRVMQIFRAGDVGEPAATELARELAGEGLEFIDRSLPKRGDAADLM